MRVHVFQHVHFEGLGSIDSILRSRGAIVTTTHFFEDYTLPSLDAFDLLIVLGGPMSIHDEEEYSWLVDEKEFIRSAINNNKPVLGICLGAQLIASSLGADVYAAAEKEIGWLPIVRSETLSGEWKDVFPERLNVFHWHGEAFELPSGSMGIASSAQCANQGFIFKNNVVGLQFHLETTKYTAESIVQYCEGEIVTGKYIQSKQRILMAKESDYKEINSVMGKIMFKLESLIDK